MHRYARQLHHFDPYNPQNRAASNDEAAPLF